MLDNEPDEDGECGVIINTSSVAAEDATAGMLGYAATKAHLSASGHSLAQPSASSIRREEEVSASTNSMRTSPRKAALPSAMQCEDLIGGLKADRDAGILPLLAWARDATPPRGPRRRRLATSFNTSVDTVPDCR
jgi:hypothetical protein